jgi:hypothetical protein
MMALPGCGENPGTLYVSPQKGTAGAAGATNAGYAAEARCALAPTCRFHQRVARHSLHGLRSALPVAARAKKLFARGAGLAVSLPFIGSRLPTRHPFYECTAERRGRPEMAETRSSKGTNARRSFLNGGGELEGRQEYAWERPRLAPQPQRPSYGVPSAQPCTWYPLSVRQHLGGSWVISRPQSWPARKDKQNSDAHSGEFCITRQCEAPTPTREGERRAPSSFGRLNS